MTSSPSCVALGRECRILREEKENVWLKQRPGSQRRVRVRHPGGVRVRQRLNQACYPVRRLCGLLGVPGGYYAWLSRPPSAREKADRVPGDRIVEVHSRSRGAYGAPRVHAELFPPKAPVWHVSGWPVSCARPAIQGVHRRRKVSTTRRNPQSVAAPDLVRREFTADGAEPASGWDGSSPTSPPGPGSCMCR